MITSKYKYLVVLSLITLTLCTPDKKEVQQSEIEIPQPGMIVIKGTDYTETTGPDLESPTSIVADTWLSYDVNFLTAGRYQVQVSTSFNEAGRVWIEDHYDNPDGRTYNVTGTITIGSNGTGSVDGSPFNSGTHKIKVHALQGEVAVKEIIFRLMVKHQVTQRVFEQSMEGSEWQLIWSDEFEGNQVDTAKWSYDIGDWGWGNNELQYYTRNRPENARIEDGHLIIEAHKNHENDRWTSARLTTRQKAAFKYGKIEFRARVPREKGNWAAGWTLGDSYVDEKSWPYCGEIDILESVGYEVNNESGDGIAHATVHTLAYYFKIDNQISSSIDVKNIAGEFHTYAVEWAPEEIRGYVDGEQYYLYDKTANELEWPFDKPQNIILNLAMGGGWGGAQGMDTTVTSQQYILDYVRVYGKGEN